MKTLGIAEAPDLLAKYETDPDQDPVILTVKGKPVAVVLPVHGADVETISLSLHPKFLAIMERSQRRYDKEGGIPIEEIRQRLGMEPFKEPKPTTKGQQKTGTNRKPQAKNRKPNGKKDGSQV
jgi:antitoxin (DNA-binding transcriptional repressor) of toxin-antitoxin stability system